jgi:hypothetical protein
LGVTAYRLVMGEYPPPFDVQQDEHGEWQVTSPDPRPLLENNPRVQPLLREWILRLLSDAPEMRGSAEQLAEALEAEADENVPVLLPASAPAAEVPPPEALIPAGAGEPPERPSPRARVRAWKSWLALAAAGASAVLLWTLQPVPGHLSSSTQQTADSQAPDAGTAAVGDTSPTAPLASVHPPSEQEPIAQGSVPRPGQPRPDKKGRCPGDMQVAINGGCWVENPSMTAEACAQSGYMLLKGKCYSPALEPPQKPLPTSNPTKAR